MAAPLDLRTTLKENEGSLENSMLKRGSLKSSLGGFIGNGTSNLGEPSVI
jgi:hypothetical protein